ncbi:MAG: diguanylate cyclase [Desulfonatronovibrio sp.]
MKEKTDEVLLGNNAGAMEGGSMEASESRKSPRSTIALYNFIVRPVVSFFHGWSITTKVQLLLVILIVLPSIGGLIILESRPEQVQALFILALIGTLACLGPMSRFIADYLVMREMREVERFCQKLKCGEYHVRFEMPPQQDHERDILVLKRNLNWMAHVISRRELQLQDELAKTHKDKIRYANMSMLDALTGLFNRRGLEAMLEEKAHEAAATGRPLSMLFLDVDKFKAVNDTYGHQVGDELLRSLGGIIQANVRQNVDVPFRYGGDEFGVLLVGIDLDKATRIAQRIFHGFRAVCIGESRLSIGLSRMETTEAGHVADAQAMLAAADQAAYTAKRNGGDRINIADKKGFL